MGYLSHATSRTARVNESACSCSSRTAGAPSWRASCSARPSRTNDVSQSTTTAAARLVAEGAAAVVVDCETSFVRLGLAEQLARQLGAPAVRLEQLHADSLTRAVRDVA